MDYKVIWKAFLDTEEPEFKKAFGFGKKDIRKVGVRRFVKANGWASTEDVVKWRTDKLHVTICPSCKKDFGIMDDSLGLCDKCVNLFDLNSFYEDIKKHAKTDQDIAKSLTYFYCSPRFRDNYRLNKVN